MTSEQCAVVVVINPSSKIDIRFLPHAAMQVIHLIIPLKFTLLD